MRREMQLGFEEAREAIDVELFRKIAEEPRYKYQTEG